tara:strand:- start:142 stop:594 length:453 start_codon:yes stop_codon:yes gene_type:complete
MTTEHDMTQEQCYKDLYGDKQTDTKKHTIKCDIREKYTNNCDIRVGSLTQLGVNFKINNNYVLNILESVLMEEHGIDINESVYDTAEDEEEFWCKFHSIVENHEDALFSPINGLRWGGYGKCHEDMEETILYEIFMECVKDLELEYSYSK